MRLIDADMLIEEIEKIALEVEQQTQGRRNGKTLAQGILFGFGAMRKTVLEQPTAYDPDRLWQSWKSWQIKQMTKFWKLVDYSYTTMDMRMACERRLKS